MIGSLFELVSNIHKAPVMTKDTTPPPHSVHIALKVWCWAPLKLSEGLSPLHLRRQVKRGHSFTTNLKAKRERGGGGGGCTKSSAWMP